MTVPATVFFRVRGLPVAQGSARAFVAGGKARIATDSNRSNSPIGAWRGAIAKAASDAMEDAPAWACPVAVHATFFFPRPKSHYLPVTRTRLTRQLRLDAPNVQTSKPDIDKLLRALLDGITNVVVRDDSQVATVRASKQFEDDQAPTGVTVRVERLAGTR